MPETDQPNAFEHDPHDAHEADRPDAEPGPRGPFARIRAWYGLAGYRSWRLITTAYVIAGASIGWESLTLLLGFADLWPFAVPLIVIGIAVVAVIRERRERRRAARDDATDATDAADPA